MAASQVSPVKKIFSAINIEVAGICICLKIHSLHALRYIEEEYKNFSSSKASFLFLNIKEKAGACLNKSCNPCAVFLGSEITINDEYFFSRIDVGLKKGNAVISAAGIKNGIDTLLRNVFTILLLAKYNGIALHAAGIVKGGKAYIFAGASQNGKSTVSRLSLKEGCAVLSDDLVFIRKIRNKYYVFPTPSWLHMQSENIENRPYPIGGIFKLYKDDKIFLKNIPRGSALAEIFTIPGVAKEFLHMQWLLGRFYDIIKKYPYYELHFKKEESFWNCMNV